MTTAEEVKDIVLQFKLINSMFSEEELKQLINTDQIEQQLTYGVTFAFINPNNVEQKINCYQNEYIKTLLCFITKSGYSIILDLHNVRVTQTKEQDKEKFKLHKRLHLELSDQTQKILLLFQDEADKMGFQYAIKVLVKKIQQESNEEQELSVAIKYFLLEDLKQKKSKVTRMKFEEIVSKLNFENKKKNSNILKNIKNQTKEPQDYVTYDEFLIFLKIYFCRIEIYQIFCKFTKNPIKLSDENPSYEVFENVMTLDELQRFNNGKFLESEIKKLKSKKILNQQNKTSLFGFCKFVLSKQNSIMNQHKCVIYQDATRPLNEYYCFSSHNTYLDGNQLTSNSKVQRYMEDLERGFRCVQLDIHDHGDIPVIKHGGTFTTYILFEKVIEAIARFSKKKSHTPIILSLQNHCNKKNKQKMSQILIKNFGDRIYIPNQSQKTYHSLIQLKNKIIIKTDSNKNARKHKQNKGVNFNKKQEQYKPMLDFMLNKVDNSKVLNERLALHLKKKEQFSQVIQRTNATRAIIEKKIERQLGLLEDEQKMASLTGLFKGAIADTSVNFQSVSLSALQVKKRKKEELISFTNRSWLRIYPDGLKIDSSNYNPIPNMQIGAQIIAVNSQNKDNFCHILFSHFQENGGVECGYVLKPEALRKNIAQEQQPITLKIRVIMGLNIFNLESFDLFTYHIDIAFFGSQIDNIPQNKFQKFVQATQEVKEQNADFRKSPQIIYKIKKPYYGFVLFQIKNYGKVSIPVRLMRTGYKILKLRDSKMQILQHSGILVHIQINKSQ